MGSSDRITSLWGSLPAPGSQAGACVSTRRAGAHPAGPVDEVIQLGHHIFASAAGKGAGFGDHCSGFGYSRLDAGHRTRHGEVSARQDPRGWALATPTAPTLGPSLEQSHGHSSSRGQRLEELWGQAWVRTCLLNTEMKDGMDMPRLTPRSLCFWGLGFPIWKTSSVDAPFSKGLSCLGMSSHWAGPAGWGWAGL